jgi:hypothetical protein
MKGDLDMFIRQCQRCGVPSAAYLCWECSQKEHNFSAVKPAYTGFGSGAVRVRIAERFTFNRDEEKKEESSPFLIKAVC